LVLLRPLGPGPALRRVALPDRGILLQGKLLARRSNQRGINDLPAHGQKALGCQDLVEIYAEAFLDMHRELYDFYVTGDVIVIELSLNGTHRGPLVLPAGTISPTGQEIHAPCCDVFHLIDGKVKSFHCYAAGTILLV
jgi:hypothetical protein